jgi:lipid-A-disaccharide synthase
MYGGLLATALAERLPGVRLVGTGGPAMGKAGVHLVAELGQIAVMGFAELVPRLSYFRRLERTLMALLSEIDLTVAIDFPGLNMRVARAAKERRVPVLYYVPPKVWAWRPGRARALAAITDRVAAVLPFEVETLVGHGVRATFVGHPLLDRTEPKDDRGAFCARWGLDRERPVLALLPGSRTQEIGRHLDLFVAAAKRISRPRPDVQPVIGRAPTLSASLYRGVSFPVVDDVPSLLAHAHAALLKSGTVTLEAGLAQVPSVVVYRTSALSWALARRLVRVDHVALPNLILGERAMPEYLQSAASADTLAEALLPLLGATPQRRAQLDALVGLRSALGEPGATGRVADLAMELLEASR